jgi:hypothetical protein
LHEEEKNFNTERRQRLYRAAEEFSEKLKVIECVSEVGVAGSFASEEEYPLDIDIFIFLRNLNQFPLIARYARQISSIYHNWEVFVFSEDLNYLGRVCHRRNCPSSTMDCYHPYCGRIPHLYITPDFIFKPEIFLRSPFKIFWSRHRGFLWHKWRDKLNISETHGYPKYESIKKICVECGKEFIYSIAEQKIFKKRGYLPPKRCPECREKKKLFF